MKRVINIFFSVVQDLCESGAEGDLEVEREDLEEAMSSPGKAGVVGVLGGSGTVSKATIAVSDVDGRAFDILLRYVRII